MSLSAIAKTIRSKRFWIWQLGGAVIYIVPAAIRLATGSVILPVLSYFAVPGVGHYIPGNLVEKIIVNAFFPGAAGAIAGEIFYVNKRGQFFSRRQKYLARLVGALLWTAAWSLFQLWGNMQNIKGGWGGNIFEYPSIYPLNFLLASLSIFTPTIVGFAKSKITGAYGTTRYKRKKI